MENRRQFIKVMAGFLTNSFLLLNPFSSLVRSAYSKARKILLPENTTRESLIQKHPASLDARNLPVTPVEDFETMGATTYEADLKTWRLHLTGEVEEPMEMTYSQILSEPSIERKVLLICPGFFANQGRWKGVSMKPVLEKAKVKSGATHVKFLTDRGTAAKVEQFPIEDVLSNRVFLAYAVNGETLPEKHGYPLRIVAEGYYGDDWIKYVSEMNVVRGIVK